MSGPIGKTLLVVFVISAYLTVLNSSAKASGSATGNPKLGLNYTELPRSIKALRFVFECEDGLQIEARWIAQDVGDVAPANILIAKVGMVTQGPLNVAQLSQPTNGWPLGLYRLELWYQQKPIHTVYYAIEALDNIQK